MPLVRYNELAVSPKVDFLEGKGYHLQELVDQPPGLLSTNGLRFSCEDYAIIVDVLGVLVISRW